MKHLFIIGPGGAGKSTVAKHLSSIINYPLLDLDVEFCYTYCDITDYIKSNGYSVYCQKNSELLRNIVNISTQSSLFVLSSGFMVYENYPELAKSNVDYVHRYGKTIRLLPSSNKKIAMKLIIERQSMRPFYRGYSKEKNTIDGRFDTYLAMGDYKFETNQPPETIASYIASKLDL